LVGAAILIAFVAHYSDFGLLLLIIPKKILLILSAFSFAFGTLARLGWEGQTIDGNSLEERADKSLFKLFYWIGTCLGTFAII
jgi:hypothetical protein